MVPNCVIALGTRGSHSRRASNKQLTAIDFPSYMHHHPIYSHRCPEYGANDHATYNDQLKLPTFGLTPVLFCFMLSLLLRS